MQDTKRLQILFSISFFIFFLFCGIAKPGAVEPEPTYVYCDSFYMEGTNNTVEFCGIFQGVPWHDKAACRGKWWLKPCE
ncbi:MAG: hypothetical protein DRG83_18480 [Deltaproteobacteria bacterium]|nr:MAG: hypothetical protein DRG83_18480 [Deltaproteobacteria bacterium]